MGCMVDHIHLDKKYIQHTLPKKGTICISLLIILFDSDYVHIWKYINLTSQTAMGW
jgi:hypothetical protein